MPEQSRGEGVVNNLLKGKRGREKFLTVTSHCKLHVMLKGIEKNKWKQSIPLLKKTSWIPFQLNTWLPALLRWWKNGHGHCIVSPIQHLSNPLQKAWVAYVITSVYTLSKEIHVLLLLLNIHVHLYICQLESMGYLILSIQQSMATGTSSSRLSQSVK